MGYLNIFLRLIIWFLLTADFTIANILIGLLVALLLPRRLRFTSKIQDWLEVIGKIIIAIPKAYYEAAQMIIQPHKYEEIGMEYVSTKRSAGLVFLDIFVITFTPKTIVLKYHADGGYEVHRVKPHE